eukprot:36051_1
MTDSRKSMRITNVITMCCILSSTCHALSSKRYPFTFVLSQSSIHHHRSGGFRSRPGLSMIRAPPGSGYAQSEDEQAYYPDTYDPMMEYPGTMRPGRKDENQPFSSLPIQESDPDPIPWPHFQEIEWHHNWGSPHEHPVPMEEFIDMEGRWATAEMEAEMRAGARRGVRERRELEESQKAASFILDDDDEDDELEEQVQLNLGEGVNALIGTDSTKTDTDSTTTEEEVLGDDEEDDDDDDDFLLDLGLDGDDESSETEEDEGEAPAFATGDSPDGILEAMQTMIDAEEEEETADIDTSDINLNFDDLDLDFDAEEDTDDSNDESGNEEEDGFVLMDDDDGISDGEDMVPLDDMIGNEDMGDDDEFDDGGFDYD